MRVVCLGSGPSLTQPDVDACRDRAVVIAINSTIDKAPWASICFASDYRWWAHRQGLPWFHGRKCAMRTRFPPGSYPEIETFRDGGPYGLEFDPGALRTGGNSGYAAVNLAAQVLASGLGTKEIVLLGYDMQPGPNGQHHHHAPHNDRNRPPDYVTWRSAFATMVGPLTARGIRVFNASRRTALTTFPCVDFDSLG